MKRRKVYDGKENLCLCILCDLFYDIMFCFTEEGSIRKISVVTACVNTRQAKPKHYVLVAVTVMVSMQ